jgi:hypothetical protein
MVTVLFGGLLAGCTADSVDFFQPLKQDPGFPGTEGDAAAYESLFTYVSDPACAPSVPRLLDRRTEVRIFRGNDITMADVVRFVGGLKRYYDHYGVTMFTRHDVLPVALDHAMVLNDQAILDWIRKNAAPAAGQSISAQAVGAAMFYNVKQFLRTYAEPQQDVINIVLLKRIASLDPSANEVAMNWGVAGLGLSQELLNSVGGSDVGSIADQLNETDFSPTVFIGVNLTDFVLPEPDVVIAHEFGHAYGLEHTQATGTDDNLMDPVASQCTASLDASQLSIVEQATARYGNVADARRYSALDFLSYVHRADEISAIVQTRLAQRRLHDGETP